MSNGEYKPSTVLPGATEIPHSGDRTDGRSSAFDANRPGKVIVDPDESDSFELDYKQLGESDLKEMAKKHPHLTGTDFLKELAKRAKPPEKPKAAEIAKPKASTRAKAKLKTEQVSVVDQTPGLSAVEMTDSEVIKFLEVNAVQSAFSQLGIPFLSSDVPSKPGFTVYFEFGQFGTISAKYHHVVDSRDCVVLVYDTRFEYGQQYLPPSLDEKQTVRIEIPEKGTSYRVVSIGLNWSMGCLDFVLLIKAE